MRVVQLRAPPLWKGRNSSSAQDASVSGIAQKNARQELGKVIKRSLVGLVAPHLKLVNKKKKKVKTDGSDV